MQIRKNVLQKRDCIQSLLKPGYIYLTIEMIKGIHMVILVYIYTHMYKCRCRRNISSVSSALTRGV